MIQSPASTIFALPSNKEITHTHPQFRPLSRSHTATHVSKTQTTNMENLPLAKIIISKDFCSSSPIKEKDDEPSKQIDEIEGEGFQEEDDANFKDVFSLDEEKLEAEGYEMHKKQKSLEYDEPVRKRYGSKERHEKMKKWNQEETDLFYDFLQMCGTNFSLISKFFNNRTRKMILNKFHQEEKKGTKEFRYAMEHPKPLDLSKFAQINHVNEQDLIDDFERNKEKLFKRKDVCDNNENNETSTDGFEDISSIEEKDSKPLIHHSDEIDGSDDWSNE